MAKKIYGGQLESEPLESSIEDLPMAYADARGEAGRRLSWRATEWVTPEEAAEAFLEADVKSYNEFEAESLLLLEEIFGPGTLVQPARESSVAVYVRPPGDLIDIEGALLLPALAASEVDIVDDGIIRIWWD